MLVAGWWTIQHTTNKLLFDTFVNNKLPYGMPSVVAFNYQLATVYFSNIICDWIWENQPLYHILYFEKYCFETLK